MPGERTNRMFDLAVQGAARLARRASLVNEFFAPGEELYQAERLKYDDMLAEMDSRGHFYDPDCNSPFCQQARMMMQQALLAIQQQQAQQGAQSGQ